MTKDEQTLLMFKGLIATLPTEQQETVNACITQLREMIASCPAGEAVVAIGLIGAELQIQGN